MSEIRVTFVGAGRVGRDVARLVATRPSVRIVAAWSRNPGHVGLELSDLAGSRPLGVRVSGDLDAALDVPADVAVIATTSFLEELEPLIRAAVTRGRNVICSGEEAAFPWAVDRSLAEELDALARANGVTILGAGINPGFLFDALALTFTGAAWDVEQIRVGRVVDVSKFSATVLGRLGIGYTLEEFQEGRRSHAIHGHIGFPQSMHLVARALGRTLERIEGVVDPLVADRPFVGEHLEVPLGKTAGFVQRYVGIAGGHEWFVATLTGHLSPAEIGAELADTIEIDGSVSLALAIRPGLKAQPTVAAVLANSLSRVVEARPGWLTVADLPPAIAL